MTLDTNHERLQGVYKASDYADLVYSDYLTGITPGDPAGWISLDEYYTVKRGQWTVITGIPNHGKSTWLDNVLVNLAKNNGWKFLICSPENQPIQRHIEGLIEIFTGKKFGDPRMALFPKQVTSAQELGEGLEFIDKHFQFIFPDETDFNIDYILELAKEVKQNQFEFDGFVLDPYNELEHKRSASMTEAEYISSVLTKWRRFQRANNTHGWIVAHPTKLREITPPVGTETDIKATKVYAMPSLYDISGAAHWRNKADMGVVVYRNMTERPQRTTVSVQKVRFKECGKLGTADFYFDQLCSRYVESESQTLFNRLNSEKN